LHIHPPPLKKIHVGTSAEKVVIEIFLDADANIHTAFLRALPLEGTVT
jgi:hypothetical protein